MTKSPLKLGIAAVAGLYFLWCAYDPSQWHLLDGVNLLIHEAGHVVFRPFGEFMMIAGGSLFQIIVPALFVGYFIFQQQFFSAALVLFWVGESVINVSVYAADSVAMQLPLLGGPDTIHDWNYLLSRLNLLAHTAQIAGAIRLFGTLLIILAICACVRFASRVEGDRSESF